MAQVTVTIADKVYRIACEDGQEEHLRRLAGEVDAKIGEMRKGFGEIGDSRLTVMAAITFLDEREELRARIASLEAEVGELRASSPRRGSLAWRNGSRTRQRHRRGGRAHRRRGAASWFRGHSA